MHDRRWWGSNGQGRGPGGNHWFHMGNDTAEEDVRVEIEALDTDSPSEEATAAAAATGEAGAEDDDQIIEIEDPLSLRRQELKDLRAQLLVLRRSAKTAEKKHKKALQDQLTQLEATIEAKKAALEADERQVNGHGWLKFMVSGQAAGAALVMERTLVKERTDRLRAQKAAKKAAKVQEDEARRVEAAELAAAMPQLGRLERESFAPLLASLNLQVHPIDPDGSCLFNAISHQLATRHGRRCSQLELRRLAVEQLQREGDKYAGFLEEPLDEYCEKLAGKDMWGGHLELDALSTALSLPIIVYQADAPPITFGEELLKGDQVAPLRLCFQKFAYSLGEHYDSLVDRTDDNVASEEIILS